MSARAQQPWIGLIWAQANGGVIGADGTMPWTLPEDLSHFKDVTLGTAVVMGRRTWDSLPERFRPLPGRDNIVLTRNADWRSDGAVAVTSMDAAAVGRDKLWVIGGAEIYAQCIDDADRLEVTEIDLDVDGDAFAPSTQGWRVVDEGPWRTSRSGIRYRFLGYER